MRVLFKGEIMLISGSTLSIMKIYYQWYSGKQLFCDTILPVPLDRFFGICYSSGKPVCIATYVAYVAYVAPDSVVSLN